jgi:hypothetical protein
MGDLNRRQFRALAAMRATGSDLRQYHGSAAWSVYHPEQCDRVRLNLTCRDVWSMVQKGILDAPQRDEFCGHRLPPV